MRFALISHKEFQSCWLIAASFLLFLSCSRKPTNSGVIGSKEIDGKTIQVERVAIPFYENGKVINLEGMLYKDISADSWRGIIMTHGRNGPHPQRNIKEVYGYSKLNVALALKGAAVLFVVRRGYGASSGEDSEFLATPAQCGLAASKDIAAAVQYLKGISGVHKTGIIVMGHSQGGWAAIGASTLTMEGISAAVNLCGGTNYGSMGSGEITDKVQEDWITGCSELGSSARIPMVWIYSENDRNHPPDRVNACFDAYVQSGGKGILHILPAYGNDGHNIIAEPDLFIDTLFESMEKLGN